MPLTTNGKLFVYGRRLTLLALIVAVCVGVLNVGQAFATPGHQLWKDRTGYIYASSSKVLTASDGRVVMVGAADPNGSNTSYLTLTESPTGHTLWSDIAMWSKDGPASDTDFATDAAFGPTQDRIYVAGSTENAKSMFDWGVVAYRADGTRLWGRTYDGPASRNDFAESIAVSPTTGRIFVTGRSMGNGTANITTVAYSPRGDQLWVRHYDGPAGGKDGGSKVLVSPSGRRIFVVGSTSQVDGSRDIRVIAYRGNGSRFWVRSYDGSGSRDDAASSAVLGPNGRHLYIVGASGPDYVTLSYRRDGVRLWTERYDGHVGGNDTASDVALAPDGSTVYVTGSSQGVNDKNVATIAYSDTGERLWVKRYDSSQPDAAPSIDVSTDGAQVFVATGHDTITTIAYTSAGDKSWIRNQSWSSEGANATDVAASADGNSVIASGNVRDVYWQAALIAYSTT